MQTASQAARQAGQGRMRPGGGMGPDSRLGLMLPSPAHMSATTRRAETSNAALSASERPSDEPAAPKQQRCATMAATARRIWALYDAGTPLFTREALRSLARQLDQHRGVRTGEGNTTVTVRGMDGKQVRLTTKSGAVSASDAHPDIVMVNLAPQIEYWPIEKLTGVSSWHVRHFDPAHAFLPLRIGHSHEARYRDASGVVHPGGSRTISELASKLARQALEPSSPALMAPTEEPMISDSQTRRSSVDAVRALFLRHRARWESSTACSELRVTLSTALAPLLAPRGPAVVHKVVAFACSSMTDEREGGSARHAVQHALVLTVRDVLARLQASGIVGGGGGKTCDDQKDEPIRTVQVDCFAQDPAYGAADVAVLAEHGIIVLDDPDGFLAVDETTVVVAVAPSVPVRQIVADLARPVAMIWGRIVVDDEGHAQKMDDFGGWSDPASPRVQALVRDGYYAEWPFLQDSENNFGTVEGVAVYVRKPPPAAAAIWGASWLQRLQQTWLRPWKAEDHAVK
ncbi:hypothetical protein SPI_02089 [Niveomyces insectorum RCEF 264]|uniref:SRR1-like domain-containing protein n=1 Tax=Niveomyces insectorum RCEF 264 TaxID=1081102 RepID=A0A162J8I1_9HYPO|nr:hypothetical protein SPI_02089 [Niveomyces insectorum RCEF 264]